MESSKVARKRLRLRKLTKVLSVFLIIVFLTIPTILILDAAGVVPVIDGVSRNYYVQFVSGDDVVFSKLCYRGEEIKKDDVPTPVKSGNIYKYYVFSGWDSNGDGYSDIIFPIKVFSNINATAVFWESQNAL